jgi:excinuclease UvrABC ATPase subunit
MAAIKVTATCGQCNGVGTIPTGVPDAPGAPLTCPRCNGDRAVEEFEIADLDDRLTDLMNKYGDILEKCNEILTHVTP